MSSGIPFGNYRLIRRLARGGMAEVFLATQKGPEGFERTVAVKRILPHLADVTQFVEMFMDEARLAARLSHGNVAHIYEFGRVEDSYFIAMEFIDGMDLSAVILEGPKHPLPIEHGARIIADVCAALNHAHALKGPDGKQLGIVHRDISPQNILVAFDGTVKVVDFGIAKAAFHINRTQPGVVRGKYTYMSPEQVEGKKLDGRSDLFCAGIVLYELATGDALFPRTDAMKAMRQIRAGKVPPPRRRGEKLPEHLEHIVMKALARKREDRYETGAEMQLELEEFLRLSKTTSNTILLGKYFNERYRQFHPEPIITGSQAGREGTKAVGDDGPPGTRAVEGEKPGTRPVAAVAPSASPAGTDKVAGLAREHDDDGSSTDPTLVAGGGERDTDEDGVAVTPEVGMPRTTGPHTTGLTSAPEIVASRSMSMAHEDEDGFIEPPDLTGELSVEDLRAPQRNALAPEEESTVGELYATHIVTSPSLPLERSVITAKGYEEETVAAKPATMAPTPRSRPAGSGSGGGAGVGGVMGEAATVEDRSSAAAVRRARQRSRELAELEMARTVAAPDDSDPSIGETRIDRRNHTGPMGRDALSDQRPAVGPIAPVDSDVIERETNIIDVARYDAPAPAGVPLHAARTGAVERTDASARRGNRRAVVIGVVLGLLAVAGGVGGYILAAPDPPRGGGSSGDGTASANSIAALGSASGGSGDQRGGSGNTLAGSGSGVALASAGSAAAVGSGSAAEATARLQLNTVPGGATVSVNGRELAGRTPMLIEVSAGRYTVRVRLAGHLDSERDVVARAGDKLTETFRLQAREDATNANAGSGGASGSGS
ncbi:MAG: serine/threonine protein kinase, partial [Myxococcales bacterium]|nr:serine/threonine protein kinase [Myxococcales bacterium]